MTNKILLVTFLNKKILDDFYGRLEKFYSIKKENVFIFSLDSDDESYMATFKLNMNGNIKPNTKGKLKNTIQVHKKGECFYTINALNKLIQKEFNLEEGNVDYKSYQINWESYQNKILLVRDGELLIQDIKRVIF
jgi:hypothetical protein